MLWPEIRMVIEYDSDSWHDDQKRRAADAMTKKHELRKLLLHDPYMIYY